MEEFSHMTRQQYSIVECKMGNIDCRHEFELIGTLNGQCITYNPYGQKFSRDSEFRITLSGNNITGKNISNYYKIK